MGYDGGVTQRNQQERKQRTGSTVCKQPRLFPRRRGCILKHSNVHDGVEDAYLPFASFALSPRPFNHVE